MRPFAFGGDPPLRAATAGCGENENPVPTPADEAGRLAALRLQQLLDTGPEPAFERIAALASRMARTPIALVSLVDAERQWFKSRVGLEAEQTPRALAFCAWTILADEVFWVEDASEDARFAGNPLVTGHPGIRFYAGAPITLSDSQRIGTVCVIDTKPRAFDPEIAESLTLLAEAANDALALRRGLKDLAAARDAAQAAARSKSEFLTNMSHEIRTPLNGVLGVAGALRRTSLDDAQREMVNLVETSAATLRALLDDVLDIARVESGRLELRMDGFHLGDVIRQAAALFDAAAAQKGIGLVLGSTPDNRYLGDPTRLRQILCNLVSNAVKFTEVGEVEITVAVEPVVDGDRVRITVRDTGIGFGPELLDRLFQRFEQGDGSLTRRRGGAGLGLAISRALAELMGGTLEAASTPGEGSTFVLAFEMQHVEAAAPAEPVDLVCASQAPVRILLAEDHAANRRVIELILAASDVELVAVENGAEAVEAFTAGRFDLVLMDMQMPVMDGLTAIREIRRREGQTQAPRTPVCMLSAHAMPEHIEAAICAGADSYLAKPITAQALLSTVAGAVDAVGA